jgi:molybdate transport system permease protein
VVPAVLGVTFLGLPMVALLARTPWQDFLSRLTEPAILDALRLSLVTSLAAVVVVSLVGVPLAWALARVDFPGRSVVRALVIVPLVLPPVVGGVALLSAFGRNGLVGGPLRDAFGITVPFTTLAVVIAHAFVALPFFVLAVEGALRATDREYDVVAATLGASRWTIFRRVSLPLAGPGLLAGLVLGWARALGEFGATITFAGNYPGTTRTMPNAIYVALQSDQDAALVLSVILMLVSVAVLALLRERWFDTAVQGAVRR